MINIVSTFTADVMRPMLDFLLQKFCTQEIKFFYNQIFQQTLFSASEFNQNENGLNVILIRLSDLLKYQNKSTPSKADSQKLNDLVNALCAMEKSVQVPALILITPSLSITPAEIKYYAKIERLLQSKVAALRNIIYISSKDVIKTSTSQDVFNTFTEKYGHIPYSLEFYNLLATMVARKHSLLSRKPYKVIVLDCDGTLWDGIVEEDGCEGITVDKHFSKVHQFIIDCFHRGFLICLCSKNSEVSVLSAFESHPEILLDIKTHICTHKINWQPKSVNVKEIAHELNLDLNSFIFIDDNPLECAEVKAAEYDVLAITLPKNKADRLDYLENIWAFDTLTHSEVDSSRTEFYQKNRLRDKLKHESISYLQFLKKLQIKTHITPAKAKDYDRIFQLSERTNQFNLRPHAMTAAQFNQSIVSHHFMCLVIDVTDKFMSYGLVGAIVYNLTKDSLIIHAMFLSCRILSRGIEYHAIKYLAEVAAKSGIKQIELFFSVTSRNIPAITFLKQISGATVLADKSSIIVPVEKIKDISPLIAENSVNPKTDIKPDKQKYRISHEFMLEIAESAVEKAKEKTNTLNPKDHHEFDSIKINLFEILSRNGIKVAHVTDSFMSLGLDSLRSVLLAGEIYQLYHVEINPVELLHANLTINQLTKHILTKIKQSVEDYPVIHSTDEINIPLSNAQKRLWFDEKISNGVNAKNNMFVAYEISGAIDVEAMTRSFVTLIERYDALQFSFFDNDCEPFIVMKPLNQISFKIELFESQNELEINKYVVQFKQKHFNLSHAPLLRVSLINAEGDKPILLLCIHHIIHDGWSLNILLKDLSYLYEALAKSHPIHLNNYTPTYIDYIYWQKSHITEPVLLEQKKFWEHNLSKLQKLELIYDRPRTENNDVQLCQRINFQLDALTTQQLKKFSVYHQATLYEILISAFGLFLSHYTNQNDISFVTAVSGRHHPRISHVVGFFVNLLLIRLNITPTQTFIELLKNNKKTLASTFANQDLPFTDILSLTGETVNSKINSFSQAGFIFQNYPTTRLEIHTKSCKRVYADDHAELLYDSCKECRFGHLVCFMQESGNNLHGLFEYNSLLFDEKTILHMVSSFKTLLKNITKQHDCIAIEIPLLSKSQKNKLFYKWNPAVSSLPVNSHLLTYFAEQVTKNPRNIAIKNNDEILNYEVLDKKSNQLAHCLMAKGVGFETPVAILLEKGISQVIAILGTIKAGGCYVPLEQELPHQRIRYIMNDAQISHIIVDNLTNTLVPEVTTSEVQVINLLDKNLQSESCKPVISKITSNQLACILYTSGSTGKPKGVMIEQCGILRLVISCNYISICSSDNIAQTSSFLFDASTLEIWGSLLNGATLVLADHKILLDKDEFSIFLNNEKISILFLTTQLFHSYSLLAPFLFKKIKYLIVGGEAVSSIAVSRIFNQNNHPRFFINGYGPTENTTFSTTYLIKNTKQIISPIPIGKPITGTRIYVLGKNFNPLPIGAPGKLYVGGLGLARQYVNYEELNHEKFIHLFNERLYDTGDIVAWQYDGNLKYIGREDNQIKINGYRIELNEIESQLMNHHLIEQAIVLVKNKDHHRQLVAYVLLKDNHRLLDVNLYHHLKISLPKYMIPAFYCKIDHVPMNHNGKVDKQMLAHLFLEQVSYTKYESPSDLQQEKLISIFAHVLRLDSNCIGINSEFFDIGGNSISALSLINLINDRFRININFSTLYAYSSVKLLSEQISNLLNTTSVHSYIKQTDPYEDSLKIIKPGNENKIPLIFVHPIGGTGFCYLDLIKLLPDDQPCYLIQDPSIDANKILFDDILSMARCYNKLLLKQFKIKKFILAGYSFGGMLAIEMVSQLTQKKLSHRVDCIISFDTWIVSNLLDTKAKEALKLSIMQQYERVATNLSREKINPQPWMELYYYRLQDLGFNYVPPKVAMKIILFKAQQQSSQFSAMNSPSNYLSLHTTLPVDVHLVSGNHDTILQLPHVIQINHILQRYLNDYKND